MNGYTNQAVPKNKSKLVMTNASYLITVLGATLGIIANFVKYITVSSWLFSRKTSMVELILETFDNPNYTESTGDKIVLGIIVTGIIFSLLTFVAACFKKMTATIVFAVFAILPFLMIGQAYIHYAATIITIVGAVFYKIASSLSETPVSVSAPATEFPAPSAATPTKTAATATPTTLASTPATDFVPTPATASTSTTVSQIPQANFDQSPSDNYHPVN